ncbi:glucokinase [bacterium]|nr:glucokinase [bacterium]MBU1989617.1 glucokinase [bacterium]
MLVLAGDIGGTKTNLALYKSFEGKLEIIEQAQFWSRDFLSFTDVVELFQSRYSPKQIDAACFGIAGPVIEGRCITTNLPWDIKTDDLKRYLGTERIRLLNDLEATAYGMLNLDEEQFIHLNPHARSVDANRCVIAAGTGLGEAILFYDGKEYHPIGSEGGHSDFAPLSEQQDALLQWMRKRYTEHVSFERILSGPGIFTLYEFLLESGFAPEPQRMKEIPEDADKSATISACALEDNDPLCMETLKLFCEIYGAEAGNLALKTMSLGGVYIGGGIAAKILPVLTKSSFMDAFINKGRFKEMLRGMDVKISLNEKTALLGSAHFAIDKL